MSCNNCFNGCANIVSDKCVKYTGVDVPALGISNGDSLLSVENNILQQLLTLIDGTGIVVEVDSGILCSVISGFLPGSEDISLDQYISALIQSVCYIQTELETIDARVDVIEANYTVGCLTTVEGSAGTHDILQATIDFLCNLNTQVTAIALDLSTNYTVTSDLTAYVTNVIQSDPEISLYKNRMIPNAVVEYYGDLSNFDGTGAGTGDWIDIYLCNGNNGTPDKRGRVGIGATTGMGGGTMSPVVDPAVSGNPAYALLSAGGTNTITLTVAQMPQHTHSSTFSSDPHTHSIAPVYTAGSFTLNHLSDSDNVLETAITETDATTVTGTVTINSAGNGVAHDNIQPVLACYYIMYIPS